MTDTFFAAQLDAHPDDTACRLLLGEWAAERGEARAAGLAWMARNAKWPWRTWAACFWRWWCFGDSDPRDHSEIPMRLYQYLRGKSFSARAAAEAALCEVWNYHPLDEAARPES